MRRWVASQIEKYEGWASPAPRHVRRKCSSSLWVVGNILMTAVPPELFGMVPSIQPGMRIDEGRGTISWPGSRVKLAEVRAHFVRVNAQNWASLIPSRTVAVGQNIPLSLRPSCTSETILIGLWEALRGKWKLKARMIHAQ